MSDLLFLRLFSPKLFRGIRFYFALWFWLFMFAMCLGLVVEVFRPHNESKPAPTSTPEYMRRAR